MKINITKCDHCAKEEPKDPAILAYANGWHVWTVAEDDNYKRFDLCSEECLRKFLNTRHRIRKDPAQTQMAHE